MRAKYRRKRSLTLLEIMVVILLIGVIGSAVGVSVKKSLAKATKFKIEEAKNKVRNILTLHIAMGNTIPQGEVEFTTMEAILDESGFTESPTKLLSNGKGGFLKVTMNGDTIEISE